jgi:uncharacterized membrane protein YphA (DoxX/SURF4 family)
LIAKATIEESVMRGNQTATALLILRITLGIFLLQWGIEKFMVPDNTPAIWGHFYGMSVPGSAATIFGAVEVALALCFFLGTFQTPAYLAAAILHAVSVAVSWKVLIDPWGTPMNHLFVASIPVLGGFIALFLMRKFDTKRVKLGR